MMKDLKTDRSKPYHHGALREALLDAAQAEIEESGIESFSLRRVAKRAGVSHAAPAHHFGDANGLLTALATRGYHLFIAHMREHPASARSPIEGAGLGYVAFAEAHPALFRLVFSSGRPNAADPALEAAGSDAFSYLCELIEELRGVSPFGDAEAMQDAMALWSMAHGAADLLISGRLKPLQGVSDEARSAAIVDLLQRSIQRTGSDH